MSNYNLQGFTWGLIVPFRKVTDREAVLKAIAEFDELGREEFLTKYEFNEARIYFLIHENKQYDCKPILCAAYYHQHGRSLENRHTGGVKDTVKPLLEKLGFEVVTTKPTVESYRELLKQGDIALAVKTNGAKFEFIANGTSKSGSWKVKDGKEFNKVIVYLEDDDGATVYIGDYTGRESNGVKCTLIFNNSLEKGRTESTWTEFTGGKSRGYNRIYLSISDEDYITYPTEEKHKEGATITISANIYERNPTARNKCIGHYGDSCQVCKMSFKEKYGEIGKNFIHVHHIVPLAAIKEEYEVDPIKDLIPVCPNCHAMLHRSNLTLDQLRGLVKA